MYKVEDFRLKFPFSMFLVSQSMGGKTSLALELISKRHLAINATIHDENIIIFYSEEQKLYEEFKKAYPKISFVTNISACEDILNRNNENKILVLDDLLQSVVENKVMNEFVTLFFIQKSHHRNIGTILISQSLFPKNARTLSLNTTYLCILKQVRDLYSFQIIARQINPQNPKHLIEALHDATVANINSNRRGLLLIDFHFKTPDKERVRNFIFPIEKMKYYFTQDN